MVYKMAKLRSLPVLVAVVSLVVGTYLNGCSGSQRIDKKPNIVWITSEDNSIHYLKLFDSNGVSTPNIEFLARQGLVYKNAYSNAPVCSVARSTLISGCYGPRTGAQFHRKIEQVPLPDSLKMFPSYLREVGYYTSNNSKEDYNYFKDTEAWDESSKAAHWRNRSDGQPFFHVHNIGISHESGLHFTREEMHTSELQTSVTSTFVLPNHPDTDLFRYTNAYYRDKIIAMDNRVGAIVEELKQDGLLENTMVFYFGDHGGVLPGSKGYLYETGLHVPLVVYVPTQYQDLVGLPVASEIQDFVSFVDFAPTVLALAGVAIPSEMDGVPFLTTGALKQQATFSYADRFDEKYDLVRAVRNGNYKYIRNFQPFNFDGLMNNYRYRQLAYQQWDSLHRVGKLNPAQAAFFQAKPTEMLFDLRQDPYETTNLAQDTAYHQVLEEMRTMLEEWQKHLPDLSFYPEHYLIEQAFDNPVWFGQQHQQDILRYLKISNLSLYEFSAISDQLEESLHSNDAWDRYWALTVCSSFGRAASEFSPTIKRISKQDQELINRVRAAEYLGLNGLKDPVPIITECLYQSTQPAEALLILNSVVLLSSYHHGYEFHIDPKKLSTAPRENDEVKRRLQYLTG